MEKNIEKESELKKLEKGVLIRSYRGIDDRAFILSAFMRSALEWGDAFNGAHYKEFNEHMVPRFTEKLTENNCLVACNRENYQQIYGYIVFEKEKLVHEQTRNIVHWIYVKNLMRGCNIATYLFYSAFGVKSQPYEIMHPFETPILLEIKSRFPKTLKLKKNFLVFMEKRTEDAGL